MSRRLPIRWRFAATSTLLTLIVLVIVGGAVLVLEQRSIDTDLRSQANLEARSLLAVAAQAEDTTGDAERPSETTPAETGSSTAEVDGQTSTGEDEDATVPDIDEVEKNESEQRRGSTRASVRLDPSTNAYLVRRSASDTLLAVSAPNGRALISQEAARALVPLLTGSTGTQTISVDGDSYTAAVARDAAGVTAASAVPQETANRRIDALLRALLIASGLGILLTIGLA